MIKQVASFIPCPQVICGFPGVGKSTMFRNDQSGKLLDSDSSKFDKRAFPHNYLEHIQRNVVAGYTTLASSHKEVRVGLVDLDIPFVLVFPAMNCRDEYLQRYRDRGSPESFVNMMAERWVEFVADCSGQKDCYKICLGQGKFLPSLEEITRLIQPVKGKGNA